MRGLKFLDGEVIANYVFDLDSGKQDNITIPPGVDGTTYTVAIPAVNASDLDSTWVADLEIDGESTGICAP